MSGFSLRVAQQGLKALVWALLVVTSILALWTFQVVELDFPRPPRYTIQVLEVVPSAGRLEYYTAVLLIDGVDGRRTADVSREFYVLYRKGGIICANATNSYRDDTGVVLGTLSDGPCKE